MDLEGEIVKVRLKFAAGGIFAHICIGTSSLS